jgi:hypothetical protein
MGRSARVRSGSRRAAFTGQYSLPRRTAVSKVNHLTIMSK